MPFQWNIEFHTKHTLEMPPHALTLYSQPNMNLCFAHFNGYFDGDEPRILFYGSAVMCSFL